MRRFHVGSERFAELDKLLAELPARGFIGASCAR